MRKTFNIIVTALALAACSTDGDAPRGAFTDMPVTLSIPAAGLTRSPGDPGGHEAFALPEWAYLYVCTTADDGVWSVAAAHTRLAPDGWRKTAAAGDSVYTYTGPLNVRVPSGRTGGRVYAAVSAAPLWDVPPRPADVRGVEDISFDVTAALGGSLRDVYSSPYNMTRPDGLYYGTIDDAASQAPHAALMLYHVAAKVDLMWNVAADVRRDVRLTFIEARGLKEKGCLLFRPMENRADSPGQGYSLTVLDGDAGRQWLGRACFYAIPVTDGPDQGCSLRLLMRQNGDTESGAPGGGRAETVTGLRVEGTPVHTPWIRGLINVRNKLY